MVKPESEAFRSESEAESIEDSVFRMPITYVDPVQLHLLSPAMIDDLELLDRGTTTPETNPQNMYMHLFQPDTEYGKRTLKDWANHYTSDTTYLTDTQSMIQSEVEAEAETEVEVDSTTFLGHWNDITTQPNFMEKYNYIEWTPLQFLNQSPAFLQMFSMINLSSPVLSLLLPVVLLVVPFVILRIRGVSLSMEEYINVLADIARHHFIGKAIATLRKASFDKWIYGGLMLGFYALQIYQNITSCQRFYRHLTEIQTHLLMIKVYVRNSARRMDAFVEQHRDRFVSSAYQSFCVEVARRSTQLWSIYDQLDRVHDGGAWTASTAGWSNVGYMLTCYYAAHTSAEWKGCIRYSMGFRGWQENVSGLSRRWRDGSVGVATFVSAEASTPASDDAETEIEIETKPEQEPEEKKDPPGIVFTQQYYLPLGNDSVKNDSRMDRNLLLTGPNASGKTTYLKTTLLNVIFTQQFGGGCYRDAQVPHVYTHLHSYLNIPDTSERDSLFQAEARRCKEILDAVRDRRSQPLVRDSSVVISKDRGPCLSPSTVRHFCIFDELYSGTNPKEATKSAFAFLKYLSRFDHVDFLLTTHYTQVCEDLEQEDRIQVCQMAVDTETDPTVHRFTYCIEPGISHVEGATQILADMNYPAEILATMRTNTVALPPVPPQVDEVVVLVSSKGKKSSQKAQKKIRT